LYYRYNKKNILKDYPISLRGYKKSILKSIKVTKME
jgi:hypothetical protein